MHCTYWELQEPDIVEAWLASTATEANSATVSLSRKPDMGRLSSLPRLPGEILDASNYCINETTKSRVGLRLIVRDRPATPSGHH